MKGFDLNHLYSLRRNQMKVDTKANGLKHSYVEHADLTKLSKSDMTLIEAGKSALSTEKGASSKKEAERVWRPNDSRKQNYGHMKTDETQMCNQRRVGYLSSKRLGKVMTRTHLRSLLAVDEPGVPSTYYMDFIDHGCK
jgi:hypothetical protein